MDSSTRIGWEHIVYSGVTAAAWPLYLAQLAYRSYNGQETSRSSRERLGLSSKERPQGPLIWFHTSNISESAVALPVIFRCLLDYNENVHLLLTTGSHEAHDLLSSTLPPRVILQFAPLEVPAAAWLFIRKWRPQIGIFMEGELRPNLLEVASRGGVKLALLNAKLGSQAFLRWHTHPLARNLMSRMVSHFSLIIPQSDLDVGRFRMMGATLQQMPGWCADLKYAAAMGSSLWHMWRPPPDKIIALKKAVAGRALWVAANTHECEDERIGRVHQALQKDWPRLLTILAPRQPGRAAAVRRQLAALGLSVALWSQEPRCYAVDVLVVDVAGELPLIFSVAEIVFVGHSLHHQGAGGQNLAEAAVGGCALLVGEHAGHFGHMAEELNQSALAAAEEAAAAVTNSSPMNDEMYEPYASSGLADVAGGAADDAVASSSVVGPHGRHGANGVSSTNQQLSNWRHSALEEVAPLRMARPSTAPAALSYTADRAPSLSSTRPNPPISPTTCSPSGALSSASSQLHPSTPAPASHPHSPASSVDSEPGSPVTRFRRRAVAGLRMRAVSNAHHDEVASLHSESVAGTPGYGALPADSPASFCHSPYAAGPPSTQPHSHDTNILFITDADHPPLLPTSLSLPTDPQIYTIHPELPPPALVPCSGAQPVSGPQPSLLQQFPSSHTSPHLTSHPQTPNPPPYPTTRPHHPANPTPLNPCWAHNDGEDPPSEGLSARLITPPYEPQLRVLTVEPDPRKPTSDIQADTISSTTPCNTPPAPGDPQPNLPMVRTSLLPPSTAEPPQHRLPIIPSLASTPQACSSRTSPPATPLQDSSSTPTAPSDPAVAATLPDPPPALRRNLLPCDDGPSQTSSALPAPPALLSEISFNAASFHSTLNQLLQDFDTPTSRSPSPLHLPRQSSLHMHPSSPHSSPSTTETTPRFGQGTSYSSPTARWHRRRSRYGCSPTASPGHDPTPNPLLTDADAAARTAPLSRLHRRSTAGDVPPDALPPAQAGSPQAPPPRWNNSSYCDEMHMPCARNPSSPCSGSSTPQQAPSSPHRALLSPSTTDDATPSWMETPMSMGPTVDNAPTRAPWRAGPPFTPRLPRHEESLDLQQPNTPDSPALTTTHLLNSRRYQDRQDQHAGVSYMRYAGEYILPATHLPYSPHGPAVWRVSGEAGLCDAVGLLLREPLERRSRGHAAAQAAAKLASGLVSTVWHFLDDMVVTPALHDFVRTNELRGGAAPGGHGRVLGRGGDGRV